MALTKSRYREACEQASEDAIERLGNHVMIVEPVRSFRFHDTSLIRKIVQERIDHRPGFATFSPPTESAKFGYKSSYAYTLTWTPGHMTIVGDIGELTIVHYNAMPTLEEACNWLQRCDFDYLLGKANVQRQFQRDATIEDIWQTISVEAIDAMKAIDKEVVEWEQWKPKWRKRDGMKKAEFEQEVRYWESDHPHQNYRFREVVPPTYLENRNLWRQAERDGWRIPDGFEWAFRAWKALLHEGYGLDIDPNCLMTEAGLAVLKTALTRRFSGMSDDEIASWVYRDLEFEDYSPVREYPHQAFFQIAAIQRGAGMILDSINQQKDKAA